MVFSVKKHKLYECVYKLKQRKLQPLFSSISINSPGLPVLVKLPYLLTVVCILEVLVNPANENETTAQKLAFFCSNSKEPFLYKGVHGCKGIGSATTNI